MLTVFKFSMQEKVKKETGDKQGKSKREVRKQIFLVSNSWRTCKKASQKTLFWSLSLEKLKESRLHHRGYMTKAAKI